MGRDRPQAMDTTQPTTIFNESKTKVGQEEIDREPLKGQNILNMFNDVDNLNSRTPEDNIFSAFRPFKNESVLSANTTPVKPQYQHRDEYHQYYHTEKK